LKAATVDNRCYHRRLSKQPDDRSNPIDTAVTAFDVAVLFVMMKCPHYRTCKSETQAPAASNSAMPQP
jgi:hypothetical protein